MKGVIKGICPNAEMIDLTHRVRRQSVAEAAFLLATSYRHFPDGTTFLCVVDPGVGSDRAAIAVASGSHRFVAPDNGLLSLVWRQGTDLRAHAITNPDLQLPDVSATFHGRDIFAPAAAHLAHGTPLSDLGPALPDIELLAYAHPVHDGAGSALASVLHIDTFGNIITNIRHADLPRELDSESLEIELGGETVKGLLRTYSAVEGGEALLHWGSSGHLEVAVREGDAAKQFQVSVGDTLRLRWAAPVGT
jgi:hypothetical protein